MAKKKKKKKKGPEGLQEVYFIGDELEVKSVIEDVDKDGKEIRNVTKTPVRVTSVSKEYLGLRIIGRSLRMKFVTGSIFEIENIPFQVISETKMDAMVKCLDEGMTS